MQHRAAGVRVALIGAALCAAYWVHPGTTVASEQAQRSPSWLNGSVSRPHLEPPTAPQPHPIRIPNAATSQLLLSTKGLQVPEGLRLMVFAPHPDDETIAAGGLIQRVLSLQGTVQVVFVTNGDGYVDAVRHQARQGHASTADFIEYGRRRHDEALHALQHLGLQSRNAVFLGFPDDGIDDLWAGHWSSRNPYTSPYTRSDRPPYKDSLSQKVEYDGTDLEYEITRVLQSFAPDWVLMPDPRDRHPDHCTTGVFVLDALRKLRHQAVGPFARTQVLTYLVHYPDYPSSPAWVKEIEGAGVGGSPTAGKVLAAAQWVNLPLNPPELTGKRTAVADYQSQVQVMNPFLKQFLGAAEIFGRLDAPQVVGVPTAYAVRFRRSR